MIAPVQFLHETDRTNVHAPETFTRTTPVIVHAPDLKSQVGSLTQVLQYVSRTRCIYVSAVHSHSSYKSIFHALDMKLLVGSLTQVLKYLSSTRCINFSEVHLNSSFQPLIYALAVNLEEKDQNVSTHHVSFQAHSLSQEAKSAYTQVRRP